MLILTLTLPANLTKPYKKLQVVAVTSKSSLVKSIRKGMKCIHGISSCLYICRIEIIRPGVNAHLTFCIKLAIVINLITNDR